MELTDLFRLIEQRREVPPAPPIFAWEKVGEDFWREHFQTSTGAEAWQLLYGHATEHERPEAVITAEAWEKLLEQEKLRRAERLWSFDHATDGSHRNGAGRKQLRTRSVAYPRIPSLSATTSTRREILDS